ncbi:hypothetical protein AMS68_006509 [Peltaster fructicola]|uniref:Protein SYS1 n=1 Tax=Peltaster fructicola TaxID=286661 RepID=A0A6H0Y1U7_9PEZI|nr:hypothetical protein AMS68_006509 [Peltaster fructicola]
MARSRRKPARPGALADLSPWRILSQIAILQFCYYTAAVTLTVFITLVAGEHPNAALLLDWKSVRGDVTSGWTSALCWVLAALFTVIPILLLIARSKLVPDFALTILFLHLVATTLYTRSIPFSFSWWAVQAISAGIMISLGTWACQWRELQPMSFGGHAKQSNGHIDEPPARASEEGYEMGPRRGADRDGGGEYQMVTLPPKPEPS